MPAVLLASTGSALGGLAVSASADDRKLSVTTASSQEPTDAEVNVLAAQRTAELERSQARASRDRAREEADRLAQEQAAAAQAAQVEAQRVAAEKAAAEKAAAEAAAAPKYVRPGVGHLTSGFGRRWGRLHAGIDLASGVGSPVRAAAAGTVVSAGWDGGYGKAVRIRHSDGTETLYAHNSAVLVGRGEKVGAGEQIAREGSTGNSTGPHLHFEVRVGGSPVNPITWLRARGVRV